MPAARVKLILIGIVAATCVVLIALGFIYFSGNPRPEEFTKELTTSVDHLTAVLYSPDGTYLCAGSASGQVVRWNLQSGQSETRMELSEEPIITLAVSIDGFLMAADASKGLFGWQLSKSETEEFGSLSAAAAAIAFRPSKEREIVLGLTDGSLKSLTPSGVIQLKLEHQGSVKAVVFHQNGQLMVTGGADGKLIWYNVQTRKPFADGEAHKGEVSELSFSADGRKLASADWNGGIKVWDSQSRRVLSEMSQPDAVSGIGWAGEYLVTGSWDGVIRTWSVIETRVVHQVDTGELIYDLAVSPDGSTVATVSNGNSVELWKASLP